MTSTSKSEFIIQDVVGCGPFQVIVTICVYFLGSSSIAFTMMFMSFGIYNPGWRCMDFINTTNNNMTFDTSNNTTTRTYTSDVGLYYVHGNISHNVSEWTVSDCPAFESCNHIEFNPDSSTIVCEWGLVCSKKWIPSIIISIQMAGVAVGCPFGGHLGDAIGRKITVYAALLLVAILNTISIFSTSWQMFAVLRFFLGFGCGFMLSLYTVYTAEFVPVRWRSVVASAPAWSISSIFFSLACMYLKDWRHVHIVASGLGFVSLIPALWVPESLRWLEVKNKEGKFERVATKMAMANSKTLPPMEDLQNMAIQESDVKGNVKMYNVSHLFKRQFRKCTLLIGAPWFLCSLVYYATGFGVKALHGSIYLNLIISAVSEIPFAILPVCMSEVLGRKLSNIILSGLTGSCLLGAGLLELLASGDAKYFGVVVLVFAGKVSIALLWCVIVTHTMELYPTVVRSLSVSWGNFMSRIGGISAPFLIPVDSNALYVPYFVMGILSILCCGVMMKLPETKGRPLRETFEFRKTTERESGVK